jgi:hypothetical protein
VRADEVGVVDIGVVDVFAGLHLRLQTLNNIALADQIVRDLNAGDRGEGWRQHVGFIFVGCDRFRHHTNFHPLIGLSSVNEPLHLGFLLGAAKHGALDFRIKECGGGIHVGKCRHDGQQPGRQCKHRGCS